MFVAHADHVASLERVTRERDAAREIAEFEASEAGTPRVFPWTPGAKEWPAATQKGDGDASSEA